MEQVTYKDGIKMDRCVFCGTALNDGAGEPVATLRISDIEEIACLLDDYIDLPEVWGETIARLERAAGRTVKQMHDGQRIKNAEIKI